MQYVVFQKAKGHLSENGCTQAISRLHERRQNTGCFRAYENRHDSMQNEARV